MCSFHDILDLDIGLQNQERNHFCHFKHPNLWASNTAAQGHPHRSSQGPHVPGPSYRQGAVGSEMLPHPAHTDACHTFSEKVAKLSPVASSVPEPRCEAKENHRDSGPGGNKASGFKVTSAVSSAPPFSELLTRWVGSYRPGGRRALPIWVFDGKSRTHWSEAAAPLY